MLLIYAIVFLEECGKTKKMTGKFVVWKDGVLKNEKKVAEANMNCIDTPCYCYGRICLMTKGNACNEGNVLIDGRAVCGSKYSWTSYIQNAICKELGFRGAKKLWRTDVTDEDKQR